MRLKLLTLALALAACASRENDDVAPSASALDGSVSFTETTSSALRDQPCGPGSERGCYTNYAVVADLDDDGNLDLVLANGGGHFVPGTAEPQAVYLGDGSGDFADASSGFRAIAPSIVRQVAVADLDGDGRLDVFFPGGYGQHDDQLFMQHALRSFVNEPDRIGATRSRAGAVHAGDIDGDGDMDLVIADWGAHPNPNDGAVPASAVTVRLLLNDGDGRFTHGPVLPAPGGSSATDIDLQDIDGDFSLDIVLTNRNGQSRLYTNDGAGRFTDATESKAFPRKQGPFTFNAELCDVDGDGNLDLAFDGGARSLAGHSTQLLLNDGTGRFTDQTESRVFGEPRSDDNQVKCADVDNDGDYDLVVASLSNATEKLLRNVDGHGRFELVDNVFPRLGDPTLSLDFGDFDHDGKLDMFTAQGEVEGAPWLDRVFENGTSSVDRLKPTFRAVEHPPALAGSPTPLRLAVTDSHTSEVGQHVKLVSVRIDVDGRRTEVPARFVGGDLFRAVLPAAAAGSVVEVTPRALDAAGNEALGVPFSIAVAGS